MYKRIIPCLDIRNGRTVKGINFEGLRDAGDPCQLAAVYAEKGADELVLLDISATNEEREAFIPLISEVASLINIPFTVGGGIHSVESAYRMLRAGADKVSVNSAAVNRPELIRELSERFGKQCVVVAIDVKRINGTWNVYTHGGQRDAGLEMKDWIRRVAALGAGELLITSMDADGTKSGFDLECYKAVAELVNLPVIASGGAGSMNDFTQLFTRTSVTGGLAASIFHFGEITIADLKNELVNNGVKVRMENRQ